MYAVFDKTFCLYSKIEKEESLEFFDENYGTVKFFNENCETFESPEENCETLELPDPESCVVRNVIEIDGWVLHRLNVDHSIDVGDFRNMKLDISKTEWLPVYRAKSACQKIINSLKVCCCLEASFHL